VTRWEVFCYLFGVLVGVLALSVAGCAVSAGGFSLSLLQNASVSLHTGSHDGDPNGP